MNVVIALALAAATAPPTVATVEALVRQELKDPQSAQFSGIKLLKNKEGKIAGFCGFVNAKNSYGGYTGRSYFIGGFSGRKIVFVEPELSSPNLC